MSASIAVAGAGRMGVGIAQAFAYAGFDVVLVDLKPRPVADARAVLAAADAQMAESLEALHGLGILDRAERDSIRGRVTGADATEAADALADAEAVFEAVPEVMAAKRNALGHIDAHAPVDALIASTTSTFQVDALAELVSSPERFLNAHWLNPPYLMPLVEVSPGAATGREAVEALLALLQVAGKVPIEVAASPGYIVPRIQALALNEAARLAEEGVASPEAIDTASRVGFGLRFALLGLLEFIDWGGADTLLRASEYLRAELGSERFAPPASVLAAGAADNKAVPTFRGRDGEEYRRETISRFVGLLRHLDLLPVPGGTRKSTR